MKSGEHRSLMGGADIKHVLICSKTLVVLTGEIILSSCRCVLSMLTVLLCVGACRSEDSTHPRLESTFISGQAVENHRASRQVSGKRGLDFDL